MTIKDIAKIAGVSVGTVSNYFNAPEKLSDAALLKVRVAVEAYNFKPNSLAKSMRTRETKMIAVVVPVITNPYYVILYDAIQKSCLHLGYTPIIYTIENGLDFLPPLLQPNNGQVDGVILAFVEDETHHIIKELPPEAPVIQLRATQPDQDISCVISNLYIGMFRAIEHLHQMGHTKIAYINNYVDNNSHSIEKKNGFYDGMKKYNIPVREEYNYSGRSVFSTGFFAAGHFMTLPEPPTAIVCENDVTALGCLNYLNGSGYKIPDDVAIVGYDDIWEATFCYPQLTTVHQSITEIGEQTVKKLYEKLMRPGVKNSVTIFDTSVVVRRSTDKSAPFGTYL